MAEFVVRIQKLGVLKKYKLIAIIYVCFICTYETNTSRCQNSRIVVSSLPRTQSSYTRSFRFRSCILTVSSFHSSKCASQSELFFSRSQPQTNIFLIFILFWKLHSFESYKMNLEQSFEVDKIVGKRVKRDGTVNFLTFSCCTFHCFAMKNTCVKKLHFVSQ